MHLLPVLFTVIQINIFGLSRAAHWGYPNPDNNGTFVGWDGMCSNGTHQSPIDISLSGALKGVYEKFIFTNYEKPQKGISMVNNGHSVQLSGFPNEMRLKGGPLKSEYIVEQIHFHWWSEHTIDGVRYPLEAHIVHRKKEYANITVAAEYKDGIAVLGVLYYISNQNNGPVEEIIEHLDLVKSAKDINKAIHIKEVFTVNKLFPKVGDYITYDGSLTTPTCAESVTWILLKDTFPITKDEVEAFQNIEYDEGKKLKNNYRTIQRTNSRPIVMVFSKDGGNGVARHLRASLCIFFVAILAQLLY